MKSLKELESERLDRLEALVKSFVCTDPKYNPNVTCSYFYHISCNVEWDRHEVKEEFNQHLSNGWVCTDVVGALNGGYNVYLRNNL